MWCGMSSGVSSMWGAAQGGMRRHGGWRGGWQSVVYGVACRQPSCTATRLADAVLFARLRLWPCPLCRAPLALWLYSPSRGLVPDSFQMASVTAQPPKGVHALCLLKRLHAPCEKGCGLRSEGGIRACRRVRIPSAFFSFQYFDWAVLDLEKRRINQRIHNPPPLTTFVEQATASWRIVPLPGGGWVWVGGSVTTNKPPISGPFDKFHLFPEENSSDVGGGSGGGAQAAIPPPPPEREDHRRSSQVSLGEGRPGRA